MKRLTNAFAVNGARGHRLIAIAVVLDALRTLATATFGILLFILPLRRLLGKVIVAPWLEHYRKQLTESLF